MAQGAPPPSAARAAHASSLPEHSPGPKPIHHAALTPWIAPHGLRCVRILLARSERTWSRPGYGVEIYALSEARPVAGLGQGHAPLEHAGRASVSPYMHPSIDMCIAEPSGRACTSFESGVVKGEF